MPLRSKTSGADTVATKPTTVSDRLRARAGASARWLSGGDTCVLWALIVGLVLRMAWVAAAVGTAANVFNDSEMYLGHAAQFAGGHDMTIGGRASAFHTPGYSLFLVPQVWLSWLTGGTIEARWIAASTNALLSTGSIALVAALARQLVSPRSARFAAWIAALCPPALIITATALSDPLIVFLTLAIVVLCTRLYSQGSESTPVAIRGLLALGATIGFLTLVRGNATSLLILPLLVPHRAIRLRLRDAAVVASVFVVVLTPWTIRNATQIGVFAPLSTGGASSLCTAYRDGADGLLGSTYAMPLECMEGSVFDDPALYPTENAAAGPEGVGTMPPNEAQWYRRTTDESTAWIAEHPKRTAELAVSKTIEMMSTTTGSIAAAEDAGARIRFSLTARHAFQGVGDLWLWAVMALAIVALGRRRSVRHPFLWVPPVLLLVTTWGGVGLDRYQLPVVPFLVVMAGAALDGTRRASASGS